MNRKLLLWGIAIGIFARHLSGAILPSYEFAAVSNSITAGANLSAVANNGNIFVCVGGNNSPVLAVTTNSFPAFAAGNFNGGYLLFSNAWTNSLKGPIKNNWLNCVAAQPGGFVAAGTSNAVFVSVDGVNWTNWGRILPAGNEAYAADGIAYNPVSGTFGAALAIYEASWTTNPISTNVWRGATLESESFAESFRGITPFASSNMALCGILGDIRISTDGGKIWNVSQQASLNYPSLLSITSDGGSNLVCAGDFSMLEVSTNGGPNASSWVFQTNMNFGMSASVTNFNTVAYAPAANEFLAAGAIGANGLIAMAPELPDGGHLTWTRQTNLWQFQNGAMVPMTNIASALNGAAFANSGFFQGIAILVGNNGTVVIGGIPPLAPLNLYGNDVTNVLSGPEVNNILGTNSNANVVSDVNHPANVLTMDWYSAPTNSANAVELATNSFICQPPSTYYSICGEFTNWAFARDLRTGFSSTKPTPFAFTIIPPAPTNTSVGVTTVLGDPNSPVWVQVFENAINTNFVVNWYTDPQGSNSLNYLNNGRDFHIGNRFFHIPTNAVCGVYTNWAETMATNTPPSGASLVSSNRTAVTFVIVPAAPANPVDETNCANILPPNPLAAGVPSGQVINWYNVPSGGIPLATSPTYTPPVTSPGVYTYWAEAQDIASGLVSTNRTPVVLQVNPLPLAPTISLDQPSLLTASYQTNSTLIVSTANSAFVGNPVTVDWYTDAGGVTNAYTATNVADPNWLSGGGVVEATNRPVFIPTNRLCGTYTYYARARVVNPSCACLDCLSTNLTAVTFTLLPPAPADAIVNLTNVLAGAVQANTPIWVDLLTNSDYPPSSFVVNWYSTAQGPTNVNYLNNGTETNLNNRFFHTPNNATCGIFTNWAETMAINTGSGSPVLSSNRIPVVFAIVPATPTALTALGAFDQTNCIEVPNPTFVVAVTNGQTADWYAVPSSGTLVTNGLSLTPTNSSVGTWEYAAEAVDPISGLTSTGSVLATLSLYNCTNPLAISLNPANGTGAIQWPGNLTLLSTTNLTPPIIWKSVSTGSMFLAPNTLTFTNTNPPTEFFRLTN